VRHLRDGVSRTWTTTVIWVLTVSAKQDIRTSRQDGPGPPSRSGSIYRANVGMLNRDRARETSRNWVILNQSTGRSTCEIQFQRIALSPLDSVYSTWSDTSERGSVIDAHFRALEPPCLNTACCTAPCCSCANLAVSHTAPSPERKKYAALKVTQK
jgi:hypothetical protein